MTGNPADVIYGDSDAEPDASPTQAVRAEDTKTYGSVNLDDAAAKVYGQPPTPKTVTDDAVCAGDLVYQATPDQVERLNRAVAAMLDDPAVLAAARAALELCEPSFNAKLLEGDVITPEAVRTLVELGRGGV